ATQGDVGKITDRLTTLWQREIGIAVRVVWTRDGEELVAVEGDRRASVDRELAAWLVHYGGPLARGELATMRLGELRPKLEAFAKEHPAELLVPLVDRGELIGLVEAGHHRALRDAERSLVTESARATARAFTFVELSRAAERERETEREVEVAAA